MRKLLCKIFGHLQPVNTGTHKDCTFCHNCIIEEQPIQEEVITLFSKDQIEAVYLLVEKGVFTIDEVNAFLVKKLGEAGLVKIVPPVEAAPATPEVPPTPEAAPAA